MSAVPSQPAGRSAGKLAPGIREGLIFAITAYGLWGLMPVYLKMLGHVPATEVVAHRILWSIPFGAILIGARGQWGEVRAAFTNIRVLSVLAIAAILISLNWLIYVWAVNESRVLEASLGYFINPLMYVAAGVFILGEKLRRLQMLAVAIATLGVIVLTVGIGSLPWVSLILATLFTGYGYIRKITPVGAMPGLFIETVLLGPIALVFLTMMALSGSLGFAHIDRSTDVLLMLAGPVTVLPLLFFALSARRLTMVTIGLTQYLGPTMQFVFAIYFGEAFTAYHAVCFGLIWLALGIFTWDAWRNRPSAKLNKSAS